MEEIKAGIVLMSLINDSEATEEEVQKILRFAKFIIATTDGLEDNFVTFAKIASTLLSLNKDFKAFKKFEAEKKAQQEKQEAQEKKPKIFVKVGKKKHVKSISKIKDDLEKLVPDDPLRKIAIVEDFVGTLESRGCESIEEYFGNADPRLIKQILMRMFEDVRLVKRKIDEG